jgi:hypothetical protein
MTPHLNDNIFYLTMLRASATEQQGKDTYTWMDPNHVIFLLNAIDAKDAEIARLRKAVDGLLIEVDGPPPYDTVARIALARAALNGSPELTVEDQQPLEPTLCELTVEDHQPLEPNAEASCLLMHCADFFAATLATADLRAWEALLTYLPEEAAEAIRGREP